MENVGRAKETETEVVEAEAERRAVISQVPRRGRVISSLMHAGRTKQIAKSDRWHLFWMKRLLDGDV